MLDTGAVFRENGGQAKNHPICIGIIMRFQTGSIGFLLAAGVCLIVATPARAQLTDQLRGMTSGQSGALGGGMGGGLPTVNQASPGNLAGVLQYCVKNNYLNGGSASTVATSLLSKSGSGHDAGFNAGENGRLQTGNGQSYALGGGGSGGGIKQQVTGKVCDLVLQHGKSLL